MKKITLKQLAKILKISESVVRIHICCFEKYKIPRSKPCAYFYNYQFLLDLRKFYFLKSKSVGKKYKKYENTVQKLDKIINLWNKKIRANIN